MKYDNFSFFINTKDNLKMLMFINIKGISYFIMLLCGEFRCIALEPSMPSELGMSSKRYF